MPVSPDSILQLLAATPLSLADRPQTTADRAAELRFSANLAAINASQPALTEHIRNIRLPLIWTFGRDGYLTARDEANRWWNGCSVPLAAGREIFRNLDLKGTVGCFLCPNHAGQLRACFEKIHQSQAVVAIIPDITDLAVALHCDDFTAEIASQRLWFAAGWDWPSALIQLFKDLSGLPIPQQFICIPLLDDADANPLINEAQSIFSVETQRRSEQIGYLRSPNPSRPRRNNRICVVAPSSFQLNDLSGVALGLSLIDEHDTTSGISPRHVLGKRGQERHGDSAFFALDTANPMSASPLALASAAIESDLLITADIARADLPDVVPASLPWISWITLGRIPAFDPSSPLDAILLADPGWRKSAENAGWPQDRIGFAGWPNIAGHTPRGGLLGLIADTIPIEMPRDLTKFSSHGLLWELVADELAREPLAAGNDPHAYLVRQMARLSITDEGIDHRLFIDKLIEPAYHQGIARAMLQAKLPLCVVGKGWTEIPEFQDFAAGAIASISELSEAVSACRVLIHPSICRRPHPVDAFGLAVIRPTMPRVTTFVQQARQALASQAMPVLSGQVPICPGKVLSLLHRVRPGEADAGGDPGPCGAD